MKIIKHTLNNALRIDKNNIVVNDRVVDTDAEFIKSIVDKKVGSYIKGFSKIFFIDVTARCNTVCKYCYYPIDNKSQDRNKEDIIKEALSSGFPEIALMGAEPTVRDDLPEIVNALTREGLKVGIVTNGIRLMDQSYLLRLKDAGLTSVSYSMHFARNFRLSPNKVKVLKNIKDSEIPLFQLAFTISNLFEIDAIIEIITLTKEFGIKPKQVCIRAGAALGACKDDSGLYMSDMIKRLQANGAEVMKNCGNNLYFCEMRYKDQQIHLARWPENDTALPYSFTGPIFNTAKGAAVSPMFQIALNDKSAELVEAPIGLLENKNVF